MRIHFDQLFSIQNGMITPKQGVVIQLGSMTFQHGASFNASGGVQIGGVDMAQLVGKYLEVKQTGGVNVIEGIYP